MTDCAHKCAEKRKAVQKELTKAGIPCLQVHRVYEPEREGEPMEVLFVGREPGDKTQSKALTALVSHEGEPAVIDGWGW